MKELENRFGSLESSRTYKLQFGRRKQLAGEISKTFASELNRFYDKAYRHRDTWVKAHLASLSYPSY
jgi:hypothetical protein